MGRLNKNSLVLEGLLSLGCASEILEWPVSVGLGSSGKYRMFVGNVCAIVRGVSVLVLVEDLKLVLVQIDRNSESLDVAELTTVNSETFDKIRRSP